MNDLQRIKCKEYSRLVFGKALKDCDVEELLNLCASYNEFRIMVVLRYASKAEGTKAVLTRWHESIKTIENAPDANILLHKLEHLSQKQNELERKVHECSIQMLERLKVIDSAATVQTTFQKHLRDIRDQIALIRARLEHIEEMPRSRGTLTHD